MNERTIKLEIVSPDRAVYSEDVYSIVALAIDGYLGILPQHTYLMTVLDIGILTAKKLSGEKILMAVSGGFMEVTPKRVVVLADAAERAEEIDIKRAEESKARALERLKQRKVEIDLARATASLHRALNRLKVVEKARGGE